MVLLVACSSALMSWNSPESLRAIHENAFEYGREVEPLKTAVVVVVHEDDDADNR